MPNAPQRVAEFTEDHILAWFEWRKAQLDPRLKIKLNPQTVMHETEELSGLFKLAVEKNLIPFNIAKKPLVKLRHAYPRPDPADATKYLDPDQLKEFLHSIDDAVSTGKVPQDYADLAKIMLATGLRVDAALHIDFSWLGKEWTLKVPAEHDKCKTVYSTVVADIGQAVLTRRRGLSVAGPVFPANMTQAMSYHYLRQLGATNHMMRHSFATALVDAGVPVQTIGSLLGHRNLATTQRYAKVRDQAKIDAVNKLNFG